MSAPRDWTYLVGRPCSFDSVDGVTRLVGVIKAAVDSGDTMRGAIPDAKVTVQGASGQTLDVSLVDQRLHLTDISENQGDRATVLRDGTTFKEFPDGRVIRLADCPPLPNL